MSRVSKLIALLNFIIDSVWDFSKKWLGEFSTVFAAQDALYILSLLDLHFQANSMGLDFILSWYQDFKQAANFLRYL